MKSLFLPCSLHNKCHFSDPNFSLKSSQVISHIEVQTKDNISDICYASITRANPDGGDTAGL
jgi:hypothetical protein